MDLIERTSGLADDVVRHPWETARFEVLTRLLAGQVDWSPGTVVVDIGCGDAFVATGLAARFPGVSVYGVDSHLTDAMLAAFETRARTGSVRLFRTLEALSAELPRAAAVVLLTDVIEHIERDEDFLRDLASRPFVAAGTRLLVTAPAYQGLFSAHDVFLRHYRRYSNATLGALLERAGWNVLDSGYFFASLLPLRVLQAARDRVFGAPPRAGVGDTPAAMPGRALLSRALVADAACAFALRRIGVRLPGLSNYALCQPSA